MIVSRVRHAPVCASCRLHASIAAKQRARSRSVAVSIGSRPSWRSVATTRPQWKHEVLDPLRRNAPQVSSRIEDRVLEARQRFGDGLPIDHLNEEEERVYVRLYGEPVRGQGLEGAVDEGFVGEEKEDGPGPGVLQEGRDGQLEEVSWEDEGKHAEDRMVGEADNLNEQAEEEEVGDEHYEDHGLNEDLEESDPTVRAHPLTTANRFATSPSTLQLARDSFTEPASLLLSGMPTVHLAEAAHRVFGGVGLPYSLSTPVRGKTMQQKAVALDAQQPSMTQVEGDVYLAAIMPATLATITSVLAETRRRLGTVWAESLVRKAAAGELRILDAGGAGMGVLAVRELLRAEWERMHEHAAPPPMPLAEADGRVGGAGSSPPRGHATVLTGSHILRHRASQLLDDTTFIPRLPDYLHAEQASLKGKFDIILAPHTLWPLREDHVRKTHMLNLWSMLSADAGVMLVVEKGVPRGFELVAAARELLLDSVIASPGSETKMLDIDAPDADSSLGSSPARRKDKGMIIAPCTNHSSCPMYQPKGRVKGRKDFCRFEQRYVRPPFLQKILGARDKNFEDIEFSYLAIMRGRDLADEDWGMKHGATQDSAATEKAFAGYLHIDPGLSEGKTTDRLAAAYVPGDRHTDHSPHSLTLPRLILPPLKRRGHVIMDLCTPSGTLERWTVPRSFSKQAFRDARKSSWGDLWALGAKTRVNRSTRVGKHAKDQGDMDIKAKRKKDKVSDDGIGVDEYGRIVMGDHATTAVNGGKMRGQKMKGVRDKRDKKATGNGRRKRSVPD